MEKKRLAIFISGKGSNAKQICAHFKKHPSIEVGLIASSRADSQGFQELMTLGYEGALLTKENAENSSFLIELCTHNRIDLVVLAGYLRLMPKDFVRHFENRIINVHPSLLPKYGGKGMYGRNVHEAVLAASESITGISIHYVDTDFDTGRLIAQFFCHVSPDDTVDRVEEKVRVLEHFYFPRVIEFAVLNTPL